ncbi:MAG: 4-hydroxy-tetrahydrodipicolinate reductase [Burkholderiales bacterium]|nr:4-hydroxy-tetrahydrodipicolinate reductase [Burkholderiales bacterium]
MNTLNVGINGASGRMGHEILKIILNNPSLYDLSFAKSSSVLDMVNFVADFPVNAENIDAVIDFSTPDATIKTVHWCVENKIPLVIGTTGFSKMELDFIEDSAKIIPILISPNMSLSVNVLFAVAKKLGASLPTAEIEICEAHHRNKKDAPSGTAIKIGEYIANGRGQDFEDVAVYHRDRISENIRNPKEIGFSVMRAGDVIGKHSTFFFMNGEELSITSEITNRASFAEGALLAAKFITNQGSGLYSMLDALSLSSL